MLGDWKCELHPPAGVLCPMLARVMGHALRFIFIIRAANKSTTELHCHWSLWMVRTTLLPEAPVLCTGALIG